MFGLSIAGTAALVSLVFGLIAIIAEASRRTVNARKFAREREERIQKENVKKVLSERTFTVSVLTKNGTRTRMETILVNKLIEAGATVFFHGGELTLTGIYEEKGSNHHYLDSRVMDSKGRHVAACLSESDSMTEVAADTVLILYGFMEKEGEPPSGIASVEIRKKA